MDTPASCLENEKGHYEATFENPSFTVQISEENSVEIPDTMIEGLSTGAIVGIATGSTAFAGIGGFSIVWFIVKKRSFADLLHLFK